MRNKVKISKMVKSKEQKTNTLMIGLGIVALIIVTGFFGFFVFFGGSPVLKQITAFRAGDESYTVAELDYYFFGGYQTLKENADGYEMFIGLDGETDLSKKECPLSETGESWREYLLDFATEEITEISVLYQEALSEGYMMNEKDRANIDSGLEYWRMQAAGNGYTSLHTYLSAHYGGGLNESRLSELLKQRAMAERYEAAYEESLIFTKAELQEYYTDHIWEFSSYSYLYAYIGADEKAAEILANAKEEGEFRTLQKNLAGIDCYELRRVSGPELGDAATEDLAWISDVSRKEGDTYIGRSGQDYYVLYFQERDDSGFSEETKNWEKNVSEGLKKQRVKEWKEKLVEKYVTKECFGIRFVGNS